MRTSQKGVHGGVCGTPDCTRPARWIPISEGRAERPLFRCTECCDRISNNYVRYWIVSEAIGLVGTADTPEEAEELAIRACVATARTVYLHDRQTEGTKSVHPLTKITRLS